MEAYQAGFLPGLREDYSFQAEDLPNVDLEIGFLDNDFRDPDIDRYLDRFEEYDPSVAVLGDAYTEEEAKELDRIACELHDQYPCKELVVVPKCVEAFNQLSETITLGFPNGYSDIQGADLGLENFRGRDVHILGGAPDKAYTAIEKLTQPNLTGDDPSDVKGWDWNGFFKIAYLGEYWAAEGWKSADELSIRETVRKSLENIKEFWQAKGLWPDTEPWELYGPAVQEPDELIYMDRGGDPIPSREELESAYVEEYQEAGTWAFQSQQQKKFIEWRESLETI